MRYNLYRVEKLIVQKFHADDAKVGIMGKVFLQQQKLVGLPESGLRGEQAAEFLEGINLVHARATAALLRFQHGRET